MGHRGESATAPENTLSAINLAADGGTHWVELDGNVSADGIPYVHHDDTLERCTDGTGYLIQKPANVLDQLDAGSWFSADHKAEPLPRLSAVIALMKERNMGLNLEIKPSAGWEEPTTASICSVLSEQWPKELPLILSSFSTAALHNAANYIPDATRGFIVTAIPANWQQQMQDMGCATLHCAGELLDQPTAEAIKAANYGLMCWTVNDFSDAERLWSWGVDTVISDNPSRFQSRAS